MPPSATSTGQQCAPLMLIPPFCVMERRNLSKMYINRIGRWGISQSGELVCGCLVKNVYNSHRQVEDKKSHRQVEEKSYGLCQKYKIKWWPIQNENDRSPRLKISPTIAGPRGRIPSLLGSLLSVWRAWLGYVVSGGGWSSNFPPHSHMLLLFFLMESLFNTTWISYSFICSLSFIVAWRVFLYR